MPVHLTAAGVSLVLDETDGRVLHWGRDLSEATAQTLGDAIAGTSLLPLNAQVHQGRPGLIGHRAGTAWSPSFTHARSVHADGARITVRAEDPHSRLAWRAELELTPGGLLRMRHGLRNTGTDTYQLDELTPVLPIPSRAVEAMDFTGRWAKERQPQRHPLSHGTYLRESRRGRPGHDSPYVMSAGASGFGWDDGEVWSVHLAWSGNQRYYVERMPSTGCVIGTGELLLPGECALAPGEEYVTPWLCAAYSATGLNGITPRFHDWLRSRPHHPDTEARPRPVVLNNWEATYFDHDPRRLMPLVERASEVGVERFVLDDGWFLGRRDDTAGLGDWYVDPDVWPDGLDPLIEHVRAHGMEFGLWCEPEMVNPDSRLLRENPDWALHAAERLPPDWRNQQVLDLCRPEAYAYLLERFDTLLSTYDIAYLKWDHNRDLVEPGHEGRAAVREQTTAAYRLLDELRSRHPGVEIESCASGGGRMDLGILEHTDRVWTSDCNDALERQEIQRGANLLLPLELTGAHVGPTTCHSTGRTHTLAFRAATALFGHFGIEWDITSATDAERAELAEWVAAYKHHRTLLHTGRLFRHESSDDDATSLIAVVAPDGGEALLSYVQLGATRAEIPSRARFTGLDPEGVYRLTPVGPQAPAPAGGLRRAPRWYAEHAEFTGEFLAHIGLELPRLHPESALVLHAVRTH
ncbi:alpha-galactosidase [Streptomyces sp. bgisy091]|uniref:alpha-galactosidase n=1 Tax=Streptomyces sp. bgisy091 TaxID=3413778 RepID=UPI003D736814